MISSSKFGIKSVGKKFFLTAVFVFIFIGLGVGQGEFPHKDQTLLPNSCGSCHLGHGRPGTPLLKYSEEENCYKCHGSKNDFDNSVKSKNVGVGAKHKDMSGVFRKPYRHPVELSGLHTTYEIYPITDPSTPRHSECVDCHDSHYAKPVPGVTKWGAAQKLSSKKGVNLEYELCYRCHANAVNRPMDSQDIHQLMQVGNASYHPVEGPSKSAGRTLIPSLRPSSVISCSDCHGNDDPGGPQGPHGSIFKGLLTAQYFLNDGLDENQGTYSLCYRCHERSAILQDDGFPPHNLHARKAKVSCNSCHDPHGSVTNPALIRLKRSPLDPNISPIQPSSGGRLDYIRIAPGTGECYLTCHGKDHNPARYP